MSEVAIDRSYGCTYLRFVVVEKPRGAAPPHDLDSVVGRDRVTAEDNLMVAGVEIEMMERAWTGRSRESRNKKLIPCRYYDVGGHTGATARRCGARDHGGLLRINRRRRWERLDSLGGVLGQAAAVLCGSLHWTNKHKICSR